MSGTDQLAFRVEGLGAGYAAEGCIISTKGNSLVGCGIDEYSDARLGMGDCDQSNFKERSASLKETSVFNPATRLEELRSGKTAASTRSAVARCFVFRGGQVTDNKPCLIVRIGDIGVRGRTSTITHFVWPSGSKTVLVQSGNSFEINGVPTSKRTIVDSGNCYLNSVTQNDFCVFANSN